MTFTWKGIDFLTFLHNSVLDMDMLHIWPDPGQIIEGVITIGNTIACIEQQAQVGTVHFLHKLHCPFRYGSGPPRAVLVQ
ncbi:hypothetical protein D3C84_1207880 [compost metagenome]